MRVEASPPQGRFTLAVADGDAQENYVAFAAGAGITPILCMARAVLESESGASFALFYGNRSAQSVLFKEQLADLKDSFPARFSLHHILSGEARDVDLLHGRLDKNRIKNLVRCGLINPQKTARFFICGPGEMIDNAGHALRELGVEEAKIRYEKFINIGVTIPPKAAAKSPPKKPPKPPTKTSQKSTQIEVILDGTIKRFAMPTDAPNIVDAAAAVGLDLPFSCKGGMCCTCRCKVLHGRVEMAVNYSLESWEIDAGFVLACQSRPLDESVTLDFDSV